MNALAQGIFIGDVPRTLYADGLNLDHVGHFLIEYKHLVAPAGGVAMGEFVVYKLRLVGPVQAHPVVDSLVGLTDGHDVAHPIAGVMADDVGGVFLGEVRLFPQKFEVVASERNAAARERLASSDNGGFEAVVLVEHDTFHNVALF